MKKSELNSLLFLCRWNNTGNNSLGEIGCEIILDNIHIKYNFIILPVENKEIFEIMDLGSLVLFANPQELDFYRFDSYIINIMMYFQENTNNIMLNYHPLNCNTSSLASTPFKRCMISKDFFQDCDGTQYFYIQHENKKSTNSTSIFYELSPILVKKPKANEIILKINKENNMNSIEIGKKEYYIS